MPTYRMIVEYDGRAFSGWQTQPDRPTIQQEIEAAASTALRMPVSVVGSGRTDAGVHARGQVAHFEVEHEIDLNRLRASLNGILPPSIAIRHLERAPDGFHARYDARLRRYHYYVATGFRALDRHFRWRIRPDTDFGRMNAAAHDLIGTRDFGAFCRTQSETENRVCRVDRAEWIREDDQGNWHFAISADRFLHGMVRAVVGTLLEIGQGKRCADDLSNVLRTRDRRAAGPAAPAFGLVLEYVGYEHPFNEAPSEQ